MTDVISTLSDGELAELAAYADGSLAPEGRAVVEARLAASPELQELVARQRRSLLATQSLAEEPVPATLLTTVARASRERPRRRRLGVALTALGAAAAVLVVFLVLSVAGGPAAPTVADAAQAALRVPSGPAPAAVAGTSRLDVAVQGLSFPDLAKTYGWRASGVRRELLAGRDTTVVYYENGGRRVGYAIVSGPALERPSAASSTTVGGVQFQSFTVQGKPVVTWRRNGHTCVMVGDAGPAQLLALASSGGEGY
jgi:anti-sigma factor RsiW